MNGDNTYFSRKRGYGTFWSLMFYISKIRGFGDEVEFNPCHCCMYVYVYAGVVMGEQDASIIRFNPVLDPKTKHVVHHFTVYGSYTGCDEKSIHAAGKFLIFVSWFLLKLAPLP